MSALMMKEGQERAVDDASGADLVVKAARQLEIQFYEKMSARDRVPSAEAEGRKPSTCVGSASTKGMQRTPT